VNANFAEIEPKPPLYRFPDAFLERCTPGGIRSRTVAVRSLRKAVLGGSANATATGLEILGVPPVVLLVRLAKVTILPHDACGVSTARLLRISVLAPSVPNTIHPSASAPELGDRFNHESVHGHRLEVRRRRLGLDERLPIAAYRQGDRFVLWSVIERWWGRIRGRQGRLVKNARNGLREELGFLIGPIAEC